MGMTRHGGISRIIFERRCSDARVGESTCGVGEFGLERGGRMRLHPIARAMQESIGIVPRGISVPYEIRSIRRGRQVLTGLCFQVAPKDYALRINLGSKK